MAVMKRITDSLGCTPYKINSGLCEEWAYEVKKAFPHVQIWETKWEKATIHHLFIKIGNLFYDAEELNGVKNYNDLPIFKKSGTQPAWRIE